MSGAQWKTSTEYFAIARKHMRYARAERDKGRRQLAASLVRSARDHVRTGRVWRYVLECPPPEPWPEAMLATVARIGPYRPGQKAL